MPILNRPDLAPAVRAGIISAGQADRLAEFFGASAATEKPRFTFVHVRYYLGGMIGEAERIFAQGIEGVGRGARQLSLDGPPAGAFPLFVNRLHAGTVKVLAAPAVMRDPPREMSVNPA